MKRRELCGGCSASPVFVEREILCNHGRTLVQVCRPFGRKLFPTSFWLKCPYLIKLAGQIESSGGVHELEEYIINHKLIHEWRKYNLQHQAIRIKLSGKFTNKFMFKFRRKKFRDVMRGGVGGIRVNEGVNVKCLHLQTASFIALGHHPAGEWLKSKGLCEECRENICGGKIIV